MKIEETIDDIGVTTMQGMGIAFVIVASPLIVALAAIIFPFWLLGWISQKLKWNVL